MGKGWLPPPVASAINQTFGLGNGNIEAHLLPQGLTQEAVTLLHLPLVVSNIVCMVMFDFGDCIHQTSGDGVRETGKQRVETVGAPCDCPETLT